MPDDDDIIPLGRFIMVINRTSTASLKALKDRVRGGNAVAIRALPTFFVMAIDPWS